MSSLLPLPLTCIAGPATTSSLPHGSSCFASVLKLVICVLWLSAFAAVPVTAAVSTWTGAGDDNNFSTPENWKFNATPAAQSDLVFPAGVSFGLRAAPFNDMIGLDINAINIYEAYVITGNALTLQIINDHSAADVTVDLPIATAGTAVLTITVNTAGATLYLPGQMTGAGPVTYGGPGFKRLTGTLHNTLSGLTSVAMGTLVLDSAAGANAVAGPIMVNVGATLRVLKAPGIKNGSAMIVDGTFDLSTAVGIDGPVTEVIGGLSGTGTVSLGAKFLGCTAQAAAYTNFSGDFIGSGGFRQFTSGVQVFSGNATASTGAMTVDGGELHVWGLQPSAPIAALAGRLVLANNCTVGAVTMSGGSVLSFHESISAMDLHGTAASLKMSGGSVFQVVSLGAAPTLYSYITTGSVDIAGADITINTATYTPAPGDTMLIIDNTGSDSVVGTFSGYPEGSTITASNDAMVEFQISYVGGVGGVGGSGNDVTLLRLSAGPLITAVSAGTPTETGATITWTTDVASDSQVQYGLTTAYGSTTTLPDTPPMVTSHSQDLIGLAGGTLYHYRVLSRNAAGKLTTSADYTFATMAGAGAPVISDINSGMTTQTGTTVTWTTNVASDSQIIYGLTTSYGSQTTLDLTPEFMHTQAITGLTAGKVYHYRVLSRAGGDLATSADQTFTTAADVTPPVMADFACTFSGVATNGKLVAIGGTTTVPASNGSYSITVLVPEGITNVEMVITFDDDTTTTRSITLDSAPAGVL